MKKTWRDLASARGAQNRCDSSSHEELIERIDSLTTWAKSRIQTCSDAIAPSPSVMVNHMIEELDEKHRIARKSEKTALEVVLRMLNGEMEAP